MIGVAGVLFDLDGTLLDTPPAIATALRAAVADVTGEELLLQDIVPLIGRPLPALCARLARRQEGDPVVLEIVAAYQRRYRHDIVPSARELVFPGVVQGLQAVQAQGIRLAIVTSKTHAAAELILDAAGLFGHFDVIIGADDVREPKPAVDPGWKALRRLSTDPQHAVMVGDSADDIRVANAVPMRSIGVTYGATKGPLWRS